jgi:hypothetical protein
MKIDGQCLCGAIKIEAEADPAKTVVCHCTDCQSGTASAFRVSEPVAGDSLTITGTPKVYIRTTAESGNPRAQGFCGTCGSPLYATTPGEGKQPLYMLRVGILRQRGDFTPKRQIWFRSAQPWTTGLDTVPKIEKGS